MECIKCNEQAVAESDYCAACEKKIFSRPGGWLWLPLTGLAFMNGTLVVSIVRAVQVLFQANGILDNKIKALIYYDVIMMLILLGVGIYIAGMFFRRKRTLPKFYIFFLILMIVFEISDVWMANYFLKMTVNADDIKRIGQRMFHAAIWIPYFLVSLRVKKTFIR
ncbi:hypothetical protein ED28_00010 [[Pantoea] beijingensis]|uniref:DUF2569 domain-containing protein n=1 Tax=[Pantoea] beijingensis TaxID=1324864 RepID=A0A443IH44_9GAMM|nr:DUF2569 domain-containing protein [[Pantoea] beijingensis]RWR03407.1 hypothetical protein ED28_00010 [[Pantoea] beijingensis]